MKNLLQSSISLALVIFTMQVQAQSNKVKSRALTIPNSDFEAWVTDTNDASLDPQYWEVLNDTPYLSVFRENPAHGGNYAMRMKTIDYSGFTAPNIAILNFTIDQKPTSLTGYVKANIPSGEQGIVYIMLYNDDSIIASPGDCTFKMTSSISAWTKFTIPITYLKSEIPDSATLVIVVGNFTTPDAATEISIDDLAFESGSTSVVQNNACKTTVALYPNPAVNTVNIDLALEKPSLIKIDVYDLSGKIIAKQDAGVLANGKHEIPMDISSLCNGTYVLRVNIGEEIHTSKVQVLH